MPAYAYIGSLTQNGDQITTGSPDAFVDPNPGSGGITVNIEGVPVFYSNSTLNAMGAGSDEQGADDELQSSTVSVSDSGPLVQNQIATQTPSPPGSPSSVPNATVAQPLPNNSTPLPVTCSGITGTVDYGYQLSPHFNLGALSKNAVCMSHGHGAISAQRGLSVAQIICYLKGVAVNILEPLLTHVGSSAGLTITSGFRAVAGGHGRTQHGLGQAVDIQCLKMSNDNFWAVAQWAQANLPYNQFILERFAGHPKPWLHLSFGGPPVSASVKFGTAPLGGTPYSWGQLYRRGW